MEMRKVQETGGGTYILSLPKDWVKSVKIEQGERIGIIQRKDSALILIPKADESKRQKAAEIVTVGMDANFILRKIVAHYISGADSIILRGRELDWKEKKFIRDFAKSSLMGVELMDEKDHVSLQCILDVSQLDIKKVVKHLSKVVEWMYSKSFSALNEKNLELCADVIDQDLEADRLTILASRQLSIAAKNPEFAEIIEISGFESLDYKSLVDSLETIADCAVSIAESASKIIEKGIAPDITRRILKLSETIGSLYESALEAFELGDEETGNNVIESSRAIIQKSLSASEKSRILSDKRIAGDLEVTGALIIILENLARIAHISRRIGEIVIDRSVIEK